MTRDIAIKCPVCLGKCKDDHGAECKPCAGKGILWGKETDEAHIPMLPFWYPVYPPAPLQPTWVPGGITWTCTTGICSGDSIYTTEVKQLNQ